MKNTVLVVLGVLCSSMAFASYDSLYGASMLSPFSQKPVELIAQLSLAEDLDNVTVKTRRELDMIDPDLPRNEYSCVTTVSVPAGNLTVTMNGESPKLSALSSYTFLRTADDGVCAKPVFGDEAVIGFSLYADNMSLNFAEKKRSKSSLLVFNFQTIASGKMLISKKADGSYRIVSLSFSDEVTTVQLFPTTLSASWAHYATTKTDPRETLQDNGSLILNKLR